MWTLVLVMVLCNMAKSQLPVCCPGGYTPTVIIDYFEIRTEFFYMANVGDYITQQDKLVCLNLTCDSYYSKHDVLTLQKDVGIEGEVLNFTVLLDFDDVCFDYRISEFGFCRPPEGDVWKMNLLETFEEPYHLFYDDIMFEPQPDNTSWEIKVIDFFICWVVFGCTRVSILLLVITSVIYCANKSLRSNTHSAYVVSHNICLAMANASDFSDWSNFWLWKVQLNGYVSLYFNLATYFWMNAMILEVHFTLRSMQQPSTEKTSRKLKCLALFIWAIPLSLVTTAVWIKYYLAKYKLINFFIDAFMPYLHEDGFVKYTNEYGPMLLIIAVTSTLLLQTMIGILPRKSTSTQDWSVQPSRNEGMSYDKKFIFLSLYAWVTPLIITLVALWVKYQELGSNPDLIGSLFSWKITRCIASVCFLETPHYWFYFTGPVTLLFLINLILFLVNTIGLYRHKKTTSAIISREDGKGQDKRYFLIYLKLFVISGVCWGIGSSLTSATDYMSAGSDDAKQAEEGIVVYRWVLVHIPMMLLVSCQGLFVSALFICNEKTIKLLRQDACTVWKYLTRNKQAETLDEIEAHPI